MKLKREYIILLLIIVILSVYLVTRSQNQTHYELPKPAPADSQKINRLVITKGARHIELNKKDDQWYIGPKDYLADGIKARNMVKAAADLTFTDLISESGNYERYDLTDAQKINVQAFIDKEMVRNFDVGKAAPTNQHTFARLADNPNVYDARGLLSTTFDHSADDMRDLTVVAFEKGDISSMVVQKGGQALTLAKKEITPEAKTQSTGDGKPAEQKEAGAQPQPQWQDAQGKAVDQASVERLLSDFSKFKCNQYLPDDSAKNLKEKAPVWALTFKSEKESYTLSVFEKAKPEDTEYPALSSVQPYAFTIPKGKVETIEKQLDKLLNQTPKAG
jgi:hypothetical protein